MDPEQRAHILGELADGIARRGLLTPARIALDLLEPLGVLASQTALFVQPLLPRGRWRSYAAALTDETGWSALRRIVDDRP